MPVSRPIRAADSNSRDARTARRNHEPADRIDSVGGAWPMMQVVQRVVSCTVLNCVLCVLETRWRVLDHDGSSLPSCARFWASSSPQLHRSMGSTADIDQALSRFPSESQVLLLPFVWCPAKDAPLPRCNPPRAQRADNRELMLLAPFARIG